MSGISEGIGSAIEGGLLGRAVEPAHGGKGGALPTGEEGSCLNCGTELVGSHCHACGQRGEIHRSLAGLFHDLIHGVLHLDGKLWNTLPLLAFKPGVLTRRYIDGERAKFVSPMSMFLFSVFTMFAVFSMIGISTPTDFSTAETVQANIEQAREVAKKKVDGQRQIVADMAEDDPALAEQKATLERYEQELGGIDTVSEMKLGGTQNFSFTGTGIEAFDNALVEKWKKNPGLMLYKLQTNGYKFSWLLIPLSIPFVWLLFAWRRRFHAYDHAVFVTYSQAFMSLLFVTLSVLFALGIGGLWIFLGLAVVPPIHIYKQLRYTYDLSRFSALWRTVVLTNVIVFVVLGLFVWLLILLGAF